MRDRLFLIQEFPNMDYPQFFRRYKCTTDVWLNPFQNEEIIVWHIFISSNESASFFCIIVVQLSTIMKHFGLFHIGSYEHFRGLIAIMLFI